MPTFMCCDLTADASLALGSERKVVPQIQYVDVLSIMASYPTAFTSPVNQGLGISLKDPVLTSHDVAERRHPKGRCQYIVRGVMQDVSECSAMSSAANRTDRACA